MRVLQFKEKVQTVDARLHAEWEKCDYKMKKVECEYSDSILAFKLLQASKLNKIDIKLVLTGVDYAAGKTNKNLLQQVKDSLKKFKGHPVIMNEKRAVQSSDSFVSDMDDDLIGKVKERRRSRSMSQQRTNRNNKRSLLH